MGTPQESVVLSFLDFIVDGDCASAAALFAPAAIYHVNAWNDPIVGRDAIRIELDRQAGIYSTFRYEIRNVASADGVVFTERLDRMKIGGMEVTLHWASVHQISREGSISAARDYYDPKELEVQLF